MGYDAAMNDEFSVYQFFKDDQSECVKQFVGPQEATECAAQLIRSVGARMGITQRVIITDGGDCTNFMWEHVKGVVYPTPEQCGL